MPSLFHGDPKEHMDDVWATVLAQVGLSTFRSSSMSYLESCSESWRIFTGREPPQRKKGTFIASKVAGRFRSKSDPRPDVEIVVGRLEELARQAIKSVSNLRNARLHALAKSKLSMYSK
eukprot:scaffold647866_cov44-Prasinocladus_malaysianus.AAC.1